MAFLMLVKDHPRLPNLLNLFVYHDITHIVIEYFKFKPFIVRLPPLRPSSTLSPSRRSATISISSCSGSGISSNLASTTETSNQATSSITLTPGEAS